MEVITNLVELKSKIAYLEQKRDIEKNVINEEVSGFLESLKPVNLMKSLFQSIKHSPDLKSDLLRGSVGLATGFLTNKLLLGSLHGPLKKILGMVLPSLITSAAVKIPIPDAVDNLKDKGIAALTKFLQSIKIKTDGGIEKQQLEGGNQL